MTEEIIQKLKQHDKEFVSINTKLKQHDKEFVSINTKLKQHDKEFDKIDKRFDKAENQVDFIAGKVLEHDGKLNSIINTLDKFIGLYKHNNQEQTFIGANVNKNKVIITNNKKRIKKVEKDIKNIKPLVGLKVN